MFCTGCGASLPEGAKFCPKCGAATAGADQGAKAPAASPPTESPPTASPPAASSPAASPAPPAASPPAASQPGAPPPGGGAAGAFDLTQPKAQAEVACLVAGGILVLLGVAGIIQGGSIFLVLLLSLVDIGLGGYAFWAFQESRKGRLPQAQQAAGVAGLSVVVLGVVGLALSRGYGGGAFVIALLIAGALGFAFWRFQQLRA